MFDSKLDFRGGAAVGTAILSYLHANIPGNSTQSWTVIPGTCEDQGNDWDCGPHTVSNFLRVVYKNVTGFGTPRLPS
jgi:hypothetical protein